MCKEVPQVFPWNGSWSKMSIQSARMNYPKYVFGHLHIMNEWVVATFEKFLTHESSSHQRDGGSVVKVLHFESFAFIVICTEIQHNILLQLLFFIHHRSLKGKRHTNFIREHTEFVIIKVAYLFHKSQHNTSSAAEWIFTNLGGQCLCWD